VKDQSAPTGDGRTTWLEAWQFFRHFLRHRGQTGAIAPSSVFLARRMSAAVGAKQARTIVEIGPGTGAFTRELHRHRHPDATLILIEKNPDFAAWLRERFPELPVVQDCATRMREHLDRLEIGEVDAVVSGLPWAAMPASLQDELLGAIRGILAPEGTFATFAYFGPHWLPAGVRFRQRLQQHFPQLETSPVELRNLPPAFVYRACAPEGN
jgi:phosphatidylethanolamine/phosphatidyl-N-methylethanolamine N-methyltransferase